MNDWIERLQQKFEDKIMLDKPMAEVTTLEIGGPASAFIEADSQRELVDVIKFCTSVDIPFLVIGGGSNLLVSDEGVDQLIIKNQVEGIEIDSRLRGNDNNGIIVQSGTVLQKLVDYTIENGLSGLNKMTGVPGTVGGAIYGNAAAYGQTISDHLISVKVLIPSPLKGEGQGEGAYSIKTLSKEECRFDYRTSNFKQTKFTILEITFQFPKGDKNQLEQEVSETLEKRLVKYPPGRKTPGSFFKNVLMKNIPEQSKHLIPPDRDYYGKVPAWFFLNEVGARGDSLGQIKIADNHGNTFMNQGGGKASDFYTLAKKYHQKVKEKFDIELEPEVQLINLEPFN